MGPPRRRPWVLPGIPCVVLWVPFDPPHHGDLLLIGDAVSLCEKLFVVLETRRVEAHWFRVNPLRDSRTRLRSPVVMFGP